MCFFAQKTWHERVQGIPSVPPSVYIFTSETLNELHLNTMLEDDTKNCRKNLNTGQWVPLIWESRLKRRRFSRAMKTVQIQSVHGQSRVSHYFPQSLQNKSVKKKTNFVVLVRKRTIPTEVHKILIQLLLQYAFKYSLFTNHPFIRRHVVRTADSVSEENRD
jgi:hypothetical protein